MRRPSLLSLLVSPFLFACTDTTGPGEGVAGTWRLQTVNGLALPFVLTQNAMFKEELTSEVMTLVAPATLTIVTAFRYTEGTDISSESIPDGGTYAVDGSTITITWDSDGTTSTATVNGDIMTLQDIGLTFVYRRD